jgi:hypothetical protein
MNGLFLQEPPYCKKPKKFNKSQYQPLRADANFDLKTHRNSQSPQCKLKEETVLYLSADTLIRGGRTGYF